MRQNPPKLKYKQRKLLHFSLIIAIIIFQGIVLLLVYNEVFNEAKLEAITKELQSARVAKLMIEASKQNQQRAQENFKNYVATHKIDYLNAFKNNSIDLSKSLDIFGATILNKFTDFRKENTNQTQQELKYTLDSILHTGAAYGSLERVKKIPFQPYNYKEILNSVQVVSSKEVDTVKKKGFFSRMGNALSGKVDVQKEKMNVMVTMKFGNEITTGNVAEQLAKSFEKTNAYYASGFTHLQKKIESKLVAQQQAATHFTAFSLQFLENSAKLLNSYENTIDRIEKSIDVRFQKQYKINKSIRNYAVIGLVILVIIISIILFFFTRLAFSYESQLYKAQLKIKSSLQFKNRIVSMISHEIRSPLSIISIYSRHLSSRIKEAEIKSVFDSIQFTTNSLYTLSNQILEYSKNENKQLECNCLPFDLGKEIVEITKSLKTLIEANNNSLLIENSVPNTCIVNSDVVKIHQLLYNLIGNANKFTNNGEIVLKYDLEEYNQEKYNFKCIVKDTGTGIASTDLKHIFDNFYQSNTEGKNHVLGVGLGLNLCKDLVTLFGGNIEVISELYKGTEVRFNLILDKTITS